MGLERPLKRRTPINKETDMNFVNGSGTARRLARSALSAGIAAACVVGLAASGAAQAADSGKLWATGT
jgi:hypothetical protein